MKAEFELNLDNDGRPCIKFRHHDKDNSLEQKSLKIFLEAIKEKGAVLESTSSYSKVSSLDSWTNYEIQIKKQI